MEMNASNVAHHKIFGGSQVSLTKKKDEKSRFGELSTEEIQEIVDNAVPVTTKKVTKFGMRLSNGTYMLFTSREVRIGKNCARGLGYRPRPQAEGGTQDRGHSFSQYGPT